MKITFFSTKSYDQQFFEDINQAFEYEINFLEAALSEKTVELARGSVAVCVFVNDKVNAKVVEQLAQEGVELIALRCAGFNNVDLVTAKKNNIKVVRVPAYSPHAVAEHTLALIMALNRKTHKAYNRVREGNFSLERLTGFDLYGKNVGIIGTGKIGATFAKIMTGLGCKIFAYDKYPNNSVKELGVNYVELEDIFAKSDIISLHCPLTPETHHLINESSLKKMKDGVMLINTSRGGLIETKAAIHALKHKKIGYLGIDVYEQEEALFFKDLSETVIEDDDIARLMTFPNVLVTAHQAFFTENALKQIAQTTLKNIRSFEQQEVLENEVKAEA